MIFVSVADHYNTRTFSFAKDEVVIGKAPDADLVLDVEKIAPHHIKACVRDGAIVIEDLRPRGARPPRVVEAGDQIRVAGVKLRIALRELEPEDVTSEVEHRMLAALRERPDDDETREVYADWLETNGHAVRAEFLRTQLQLRQVRTADQPAFTAAAERLTALAAQIGEGWRARVAMAFIEGCSKRQRALGMELVCPQRWDKLAPTETEGIRMCGACKQTVTYCTSIDHARTVAQSGGCVAVDLGIERTRLDLHGPMMVGRPSPPLSRYGRRS